MKFPITREALQAFDPVEEKKAKEDIAIQNYLNNVVQTICRQLESDILGPQSKNTHMKTSCEIRKEKHVHDKLINEKRFVWEIKSMREGMYNYGRDNFVDVSNSVLIPLLIDKLKETFIGCDIIIDPLKTYLIIDWS